MLSPENDGRALVHSKPGMEKTERTAWGGFYGTFEGSGMPGVQ